MQIKLNRDDLVEAVADWVEEKIATRYRDQGELVMPTVTGVNINSQGQGATADIEWIPAKIEAIEGAEVTD